MRKKSPTRASKASGGMNVGPLLSAIVIAGLRLSIDNKRTLPGPATRAKKARTTKSVKPAKAAKAAAKRPVRPTNRKRGRKMNGGGQAEFFE
jgi:hypothetical protein